MSTQAILVHHGIKGMRWGVRRTPEQLGHAPKERRFRISIKKKNSNPSPTVKPAVSRSSSKNKSVHDLTDEELRQRINRIEMERKYALLTAKQKSKGRQVVEQILGNAAKKTATKYAAKAMESAVEGILKKPSKKKP